jgi:transcriptional regulator with XRE-family HTH domain
LATEIKNIKHLREAAGLTQDELSVKSGIPRGRINAWEQRGTVPKADDYEKIVKVVQEFDTKVSKETSASVVHAPAGRFSKKKLLSSGLVPFFDLDFAAGDIEFYDDINSIKPAYEMDIPEFSGCTAFRTYGDSMESLIVSGSILFATSISEWQNHLEYGQIYGIVMKDKRKYLKYIRKSKKSETHFLLKSANNEYDDFEIPKEKIKSIWLIHGWINKKV